MYEVPSVNFNANLGMIDSTAGHPTAIVLANFFLFAMDPFMTLNVFKQICIKLAIGHTLILEHQSTQQCADAIDVEGIDKP